MMYLKIIDDCISAIYCGDKPRGTVDVPDSFCGLVGQSIMEFDDEYNLKRLSARVGEGLVSIPEGSKLDGELIVTMTDIEQYKAGLKEIPCAMVIDGDALRSATLEEQVEKGELTRKGADARASEYEISTLLSYLASTDWYAVRLAETGKAIPDEVLKGRQAARDRISVLNS